MLPPHRDGAGDAHRGRRTCHRLFSTDYTTEPARAALRARLAAHRIDDPEAAFPFSARLARDGGWSRAHTQRVLEEYRRFLYLAMTAGHPVSPPAPVDEAWHLHLLYTRSYWEDLVPHVLGTPLHHGPTRGGQAETAKFGYWYARTLTSYRTAFGAEPPADIWPSPAAHAAALAPRPHASPATHWIIPKPSLARPAGRIALAAIGLAVLAGCVAAGDNGAFAWLLLVVVMGWTALHGLIRSAVGDDSRLRSGGRKTRSGEAGYGGGCGGGGCGGGDSGGGGDGGGGCGGGCGGCG